MGRLCNMKNLLAGFTSTPLARKGKPTTLNDQQVLTVTVPRQGRLDTWYIAADGAPYLLKLTKGGSPNSTEMSTHNQPVDLTPPDAKVQDLT
ncbi:hypothetical protein [Streptomyces sp. V1I1]|uniref:hypothetical protein n=1 Tax=Streptomyces sp. V1I1 TaxID=3042272 RepID=UPI0027D82A9E|nr:hypothetical protein [Streptomyces sp. V1I1]